MFFLGFCCSLRSLDLMACGLETMPALASLDSLSMLNISENLLCNLDDLVESLPPRLNSLRMHPNPITMTNKKYREPLMLGVSSLETIDDKKVTDRERTFLRELVKRREMAEAKRMRGPAPAAAAPSPGPLTVGSSTGVGLR